MAIFFFKEKQQQKNEDIRKKSDYGAVIITFTGDDKNVRRGYLSPTYYH